MPTADVEQTTATTWPKFRFAERHIGARWVLTPALPDAQLAELGYQLAGQIRDADGLERTVQNELHALLREGGEGNLTPEQDGRVASLLEQCPYLLNCPPIDVDPQEHAAPGDAEAAARAFDAAWQAEGLGTLQWWTTGGRGLHGHLHIPAKLSSPYLMRALGNLVRRVAQRAQLPILTQHRARVNRPPVLIDDTLFDRDASSRGGLWRLAGAPHSKTGKLKSLAGWADAPPQATHEFVMRLAQAVIHLGGEDAPTEVRPRRGRLPAPLPELAKHRQLPLLAAAVEAAMPPEGARHEFRKALAGWLLREGVPVRVAAATLAAAGDYADGYAACRTTATRLLSGRNAYGFPKLKEIVGKPQAQALSAALYRDFKTAQVQPRRLGALPTDADREVLHDAAKIAEAAGHATRARGFRRAARCGLALREDFCKACGQSARGCRHVISERATCSHCALRRAVSIGNFAMAKWAPVMWAFRMPLPDDSYATARAARRRWTRKLRAIRRKHVRWIIAPGWLFALSADVVTGAVINGWRDGWEHVKGGMPNMNTHYYVSQFLEPLIKARSVYLQEYLRCGDAAGLAQDEWADKVFETTAGSGARAELPWPKKKQLREMAVHAARQRRLDHAADSVEDAELRERDAVPSDQSPCCRARLNYVLKDARTKEIIATRDDRPWTYAEASVRAELGWRGEVLEHDEFGHMLVQILPTGWDETKLRE